jgi:hypothetical protein
MPERRQAALGIMGPGSAAKGNAAITSLLFNVMGKTFASL